MSDFNSEHRSFDCLAYNGVQTKDTRQINMLQNKDTRQDIKRQKLYFNLGLSAPPVKKIFPDSVISIFVAGHDTLLISRSAIGKMQNLIDENLNTSARQDTASHSRGRCDDRKCAEWCDIN